MIVWGELENALRPVKAPCMLDSEAEASNHCCSLSHKQGRFSNNGPHNGLSELDLQFTLRELRSYVEYRKTGLTKKISRLN